VSDAFRAAWPDATPVEHKARRRRYLRLITTAWVFGAVWMYVANGAVTQELLRTTGTPAWAFGLLGALPLIGGMLQLPSAIVLERFGRRKRSFLVLATVSRAMFIVAAAVPWVLPWSSWWWPCIAVALTVAWCLGHASGPAWVNWMADVVPRRIRGRYFAFRNQVGQFIGVTTAIGAGVLLDRLAGADDPEGTLMRVSSVLLMVAGVLGVIDIQFFHPIRDHDPELTRVREREVWPRIKALIAARPVRWFIAFMFVFNLGIGMLPAYVYLFLREHVGLSMTTYTLCVVAMPTLVSVLSLRLWGGLADRWGNPRTLAVAATVVELGPLGWLFVTPDRFWWPYAMTLISPFAFAGVMIASFNVTMELSATVRAGDRGSDASRSLGGKAGGPVATGLVSIAAATGGVLSGLMGAAIAEGLEALHWTPVLLGVLPVVITFHGVLFAVSMGLRGAAAVVAWRLVAVSRVTRGPGTHANGRQ